MEGREGQRNGGKGGTEEWREGRDGGMEGREGRRNGGRGGTEEWRERRDGGMEGENEDVWLSPYQSEDLKPDLLTSEPLPSGRTLFLDRNAKLASA